MHDNRSSRWRSERDADRTRRPGAPRGTDRWRLLARPVRESANLVRPADLAGSPSRRALSATRRFTLHLGFEAASVEDAHERAVGYAEALALLCPEVALGAAALSAVDAWRQAEPLFCGSVGPDEERCTDVLGHPGFHHGPGVGSLGWGDGDSGPVHG